MYAVIAMYISRLAEKRLIHLLHSSKVTMILGARQVGKTTLARHILGNLKTAYLNFDIEVEKSRFLTTASLSPLDALKLFGSPEIIVIDEAQRLAETGRIVKGWYDAKLPVKILLLGSSSLNLLNQSAESLTGRNEKLTLAPLVFKELLASKSWYSSLLSDHQLLKNYGNQIQATLLESLVYGGYPEVIISNDKPELLQNLAEDYLFKDILQLGLIKTPDTLKKLLMLLAYQVGSEVSISELAGNLGVARPTVERYLALLEQSYVIFRLSAYASNLRKEISKSQKIYFWDTGIRNAVINDYTFTTSRPDIGKIWENWVIAEFVKHNLLSGQKKDFYFWRSSSGGEVDLVVKDGNNLKGFEIKWSKSKIRKNSFSSRYNTKVKIVNRFNPFVKF